MFWFIFILLILCLPNVLKLTYHDTGENKFSAEIIGGLVSITLCQIMEHIRPKTGNPLEMFVLYILLI